MSRKKNYNEPIINTDIVSTEDVDVTEVSNDFMNEPITDDVKVEKTEKIVYNRDVEKHVEEPKKVVEKSTRKTMQFTPMGPRIIEI